MVHKERNTNLLFICEISSDMLTNIHICTYNSVFYIQIYIHSMYVCRCVGVYTKGHDAHIFTPLVFESLLTVLLY